MNVVYYIVLKLHYGSGPQGVKMWLEKRKNCEKDAVRLKDCGNYEKGFRKIRKEILRKKKDGNLARKERWKVASLP